MMYHSAIKQALRLLILLGCTCCLSSCGLIGRILSIPFNLIDAIIS